MKLEIGKRYVRRDGYITEPLRRSLSRWTSYTFTDPGTNLVYNDKGCYWESGDEDEWDLVQEYIEPQETKPHKHADLLRALADDAEAKLWVYQGEDGWQPCFFDAMQRGDEMLAVSRTPPTEPPVRPRTQITLAGVTFDAPLEEAPAVGTEIWEASPGGVSVSQFWNPADAGMQRDLEARILHLSRDAAQQHSHALRALNIEQCTRPPVPPRPTLAQMDAMLEAIDVRGGRFMKALAQAFRSADRPNTNRLWDAFGADMHTWAPYHAGHTP